VQGAIASGSLYCRPRIFATLLDFGGNYSINDKARVMPNQDFKI
jgi:hypothetical protein